MNREDVENEFLSKVHEHINTPSETNKNHVSVGGVGSSNVVDYSYSFYNPHNARFYFDFFKWNFKPTVGFVTINGSELCLRDYFGCRIVVKQKLVEVTNCISKDRRFKIDGSVDNRKCQVVDAVATLEREAIAILRKFVSEFGGSSSFVVVKSWIPDNKILHDKLIDSIPVDVTFRNDVVKKVYRDLPSNVEVSSPGLAANTFRNLALFDFAPDIAANISSLNLAFDRFSIEALNPLTEQIKLHLEVQRETLNTLKLVQNHLGADNREVIGGVCPCLVSPNDRSAGSILESQPSFSIPPTFSKYDSRRDRIRKFVDSYGGFGKSNWGDGL